MSQTSGKAAREPKTKPQPAMAVLYGELAGPGSTEVVGRTSFILEIDGNELLLEVFRPAGQGTGTITQEKTSAYSPELAQGCWTYPPFTNLS